MIFWYAMAWKKYGEFEGRSCRTEFWMFTLFHLLAILGLGILAAIGTSIRAAYGALLFIPLVVYILITIIPNLAVTVRRLHDTGNSGWLLLLLGVLSVLPIVGTISGIIQVVILCLDSNPGTNRYGPPPKFRMQAGALTGNKGFDSMQPGAPPQSVIGGSQTHQSPTDS